MGACITEVLQSHQKSRSLPSSPCHAFPPPPRHWEALEEHLQESAVSVAQQQKDLGSESSAPAPEVVPAVQENVGEGKGEEKQLEVAWWQLGPHLQGAAQGEEKALWMLWINDRSVCSAGSSGAGQGRAIPQCQGRYSEEKKWILQGKKSPVGKGSQLLSRDGHPGACPGVLASCIPSLGSSLPSGMWPWHGQLRFLTFCPFLEPSRSISQLLEPIVRRKERKKEEKEKSKQNSTIFCDPPVASASKKNPPIRIRSLSE